MMNDSKQSGKLIGIYASKPQSGKSEIACYLCGEKGFYPTSFAEILKDMLKPLLMVVTGDCNKMTREMLWGNMKQEPIACLDGKTPRELLQLLGTEWGRNSIYEDIWVNLWSIKVSKLLQEGRNVVVDDLRFPNEMDAIKKLGGECWFVSRPNSEASTFGHSSEGSLDDRIEDFVLIENAGTIQDLRSCVDEAL